MHVALNTIISVLAPLSNLNHILKKFKKKPPNHNISEVIPRRMTQVQTCDCISAQTWLPGARTLRNPWDRRMMWQDENRALR